MHRAVVQACAPWFACLLVAGTLAVLLVQFCGGRWQFRRWRHIHTDQEGAVQSLSLVLTLPVFLMLVLFIVQISQMMVAVMMVHYAAFAAARAASVWIPADVTPESTLYDDLNNIDLIRDQLKGGPERANVVAGTPLYNELTGTITLLPGPDTAGSVKFNKIRQAAMIPCMTISPSRDFSWGAQLSAFTQPTHTALMKIYPQMDPQSRTNTRMPRRLMNKLSYSERFTTVYLQWQEVRHLLTDVDSSPTYNPRFHPLSFNGVVPSWNVNEVGFRDPVTVIVSHEFALLPGIGRILKTGLVYRNDRWENQNQDDRVARLIATQAQTARDELYTFNITAEATFVNEGYKSMLRYAVQP